MKNVFKYLILLVLASSFAISCSDDKCDKYVNVLSLVYQMEIVRDDMVSLRDDSRYGELKGMYPAESKYILDDAVVQIEKTIRFFKNGEETDPSQEKVNEAIAIADEAIAKFKATILTEDVVEENRERELFVDGRAGGYIDFGHSPAYSKFGESGKQAFTVEVWFKLKYTEGFGSIISCFNEDGDTQTRKGWVINNFDNSRIRMTIGLENWGLMEPGANFATTNEWAHFAAVIDENGIGGSDKVIKVYLNGELQNEATAQEGKNYLENYLESSMMAAFGQPSGVGGMTDAWRLSGYIKDFHLWKSAKSEEEIKQLMGKEIKVTGSEQDLVCGWEFTSAVENDEEIKDLTGRHTARLVGEYQWQTVD